MNAPLAIGINGAWGSGKTSFMNLIRNQLSENRQLIIDFNPWTSASASAIIPNFFALLSAKIAPYDNRLQKLLRKYADSIADMPQNDLLKSMGKLISKPLVGDNSTPGQEQINASIQKINKRIIVFIDDLDRLDHQEIIEVLKLVRNTANFNNVVYVAGYDRGILMRR
jgi:predicted KAP-like P-loop ATPase